MVGQVQQGGPAEGEQGRQERQARDQNREREQKQDEEELQKQKREQKQKGALSLSELFVISCFIDTLFVQVLELRQSRFRQPHAVFVVMFSLGVTVCGGTCETCTRRRVLRATIVEHCSCLLSA